MGVLQYLNALSLKTAALGPFYAKVTEKVVRGHKHLTKNALKTSVRFPSY